jgi:hypothetical protein
MGMYSEIYVNVDLKPETPEDIINVLRAMCGDENKKPLDGKPAIWNFLFRNGSYYTPRTSCANLTFNGISKAWSLLGKGDIKNYDGEIELFFSWLMPWIDGEEGDFIGYKQYEENQTPKLVFLANAQITGPEAPGIYAAPCKT